MTNLKTVGYALSLPGVALLVYAMVFMEISIGGRVVNLDLLNTRQNLVIVGALVFVVGALCLIASQLAGRPTAKDDKTIPISWALSVKLLSFASLALIPFGIWLVYTWLFWPMHEVNLWRLSVGIILPVAAFPLYALLKSAVRKLEDGGNLKSLYGQIGAHFWNLRPTHVVILSIILIAAVFIPFISYETKPVPTAAELAAEIEEGQRYFQQQAKEQAQKLDDRCGGGFPTPDQCQQAAQRCAGRTDRDECLNAERKFASETPEVRADRSKALDAERAANMSKVR